jgi:hypothetical protein
MQRIQSFALRGIDALPVEIESDERFSPDRDGESADKSQPRMVVVGLPDASVRESCQRVRAALAACRFPTPRGLCTINLAPADLRPPPTAKCRPSSTRRSPSCGAKRARIIPVANFSGMRVTPPCTTPSTSWVRTS